MSTTIKRRRLPQVILAACLFLGGGTAFAVPLGKPIAPQGELRLSLQDVDGREVKLDDFRGRVVAVVFGYTHCPDYCPTTLARLAGVVRQLGSPADLVPVFVTLDPEHDSAAVLKAYASAFHPALIGLRGDLAQTVATAGSFRVLFEHVQEVDGAYTVDHSGGIFLIDRRGVLRLKEADNLTVKDIASDIRWLMEEH